MAQSSNSVRFLDMGQYGDTGLDTGRPDIQAKVANKQASVRNATAMKQAIYGTPAEQRVVATAAMQDNLLGSDEGVEDLLKLDAAGFAQRYGNQAALDRHKYAEKYLELGDMKNEQRTTGDMLKDSALDAGIMAVNTVGGTAALGLAGYDSIMGTSTSPVLSGGLDWINEKARGAQSDLMQERRAQHALEAELSSQDRDTNYAADLAQNAEAAGNWERATMPWLRKQGQAALDTAMNYADDPIMAGSLIPEGIGSMIPATGAIRIAGKARAMQKLASQGMTGEAAEAYLKSPAGRKLLDAEATAAAPLIIGSTEGGSAVVQTQQQILKMSEQELSESEEYKQLRADGATHEDARTALARNAGIQAGVTAIPGALLAGRVAAPFAANPLRTGTGSAVGGAARNIGSEALEEGLQEANAQVSTNLALNTSAGLDVAIDDGVVEAATQGALGGVAMAGPLQAPGAAGGVLVSAAKGVGKGAASLVSAREGQIASGIDASSPVGSPAQAAATQGAEDAGQEILSALSEADTGEAVSNQTTPQQTEATGVVRDTVNKALYLSPDEATELAESFPEIQQQLEQNPDQPISRMQAVELGNAVQNMPDADEGTKLMGALMVLQRFQDMKLARSTDMTDAVSALGEEHSASKAYAALSEQVSILEESAALKTARSTLQALTPETTREILGLDQLSDPATPAGTRAAIAEAIDLIATENPDAVRLSDLDMVLDQVGGGKGLEMLKKRLELQRTIAQEFAAADAAKTVIETEQTSVIEGMEPGLGARLKSRQHKTTDIVRQEILEGGNSDNGMPSLHEHRRRVSRAMLDGRREQAADALSSLRNFAQSQSNKLTALNASAVEGKGRKQAFQAYGPFGFFEDKSKFVNLRRPDSVAFAREVAVDASTAAGLYNALAKAYGPDLGMADGTLNVPDLAPVLKSTQSAKPAQPAKADKETTTPQDTTPNQSEAAVSEATTAADVSDTNGETVDENGTTAEETSSVSEEAARTEAEPEADVRETGDTPGTAEATEAGTPGDADRPGIDGAVTEPTAGETWFKSLKDLLLHDAEGNNRFTQAFRPEKDGSSLLEHDDPIAFLKKNLGNIDGLAEAQHGAMRFILGPLFTNFAGNFNSELNETAQKKGWLKKIADGKGPFYFEEAQPLSLSTQTEDGTLAIEPRILAATYMASIEWVLQNFGDRPYVDQEAVSRMFGMGRSGHVTAEMLDVALSGIPMQQALEAVSSRTMTLLGVRPDDATTVTKTQGVIRSMAANALELLSDPNVDLISVNGADQAGVTVATPNGPRTMKMLRVSDKARQSEVFMGMSDLRDPFTQLFTQGREKVRHVGSAPIRVANTQMKNPLAKLSKMERKVVERLQNIPTYVNTPMLDLVDVLGDDVFKSLLGHTDLSEQELERMNVVQAASRKGKNQTLSHGLRETRGYIADATRHGEANDLQLDAVPIYHEWNVSVVGRLQQDGPVTPQGDKIARELLSATQSTLDLNDEGSQQVLWLAVAQAVGVKIEKMSFAEAQEAAQELVTSPTGLAPVIELLTDWLDGGKLAPEAFQEALLAARDANGEPLEITARLMHAALTVARADAVIAEDGAEAKSFKTSLALEADGKTDGPVNAMIHMGVGTFTPAEIERFAKGGLFFTSQSTSLNDFIEDEATRAAGQRRAADLYHMAADQATIGLGHALAAAKEEGLEVLDQHLGTLNVLDALLPGFTLGVPSEGRYAPSIERDVVKNPLTVFLYGSGVAGISAKIADAVMGELYGAMSEIAAGRQDKALSRWEQHPLFASNPGLADQLAGMFGITSSEFAQGMNNAAGTEFTAQAVAGLTIRIKAHFAEPMLKAVDEVTGGLAENMRLTQQAAQVQALVFRDIVNAALSKRLDARRADGTIQPTELLSRKEMLSVYEEVSALAPVYKTDHQAFHIVRPAQSPSTKTVSSSFSGSFASKATDIAPDEASVRVSPYMTIGTGDGRMILNIYANSDGSLSSSLPVFDGVEQALDQVDTASPQINKGAYDAWMGSNVYESLADGFWQMSSMMTPAMFAALPKSSIAEIRQALRLPKKEELTADHFQGMARTLSGLAEESAARKKAMQAMASQTDHMAGAEGPHANAGQSTASNDPLDYNAISEKLNELYNAELRTVRQDKAKKENAPYSQGPTEGMQNLIQAVGTPVVGHEDVHQIKGDKLLPFLSEGTEASADQVSLFWDVLMKDGAFRNSTYYFGAPDKLAAMRDAVHPELPKSEIQLGQAHPGANVVFVANQSPETLLHEMLHTHTARILRDHYQAPEATQDHIRDAVSRLEKSMSAVRALVPDVGTEGDALAVMQNQLTALTGNSPEMKASQMSEFISYMLSNQDLIDLGKRKRSYGPLIRFMQQGLNALKDLLGIKGNPGNSLFSNIRFDVQVLLAQPQAARQISTEAETSLVLDQVYGEDSRLSQLEQRFMGRLSGFLDQFTAQRAEMTEAEQAEHDLAVAKLKRNSQQATEQAVYHGFRLNPRQIQTFQAIHATFMSGLQLNPSLLRQANQLYGHVAKTLTGDQFLELRGTVANPSDAQFSRAELQAGYITASSGLRQTANGRSDLLASFMALAMVSDDFRGVLEKMPTPKAIGLEWGSIDGFLTSLANSLVELITRMSLIGRRQPKEIRTQLDLLAHELSEAKSTNRFLAAATNLNHMDVANDFVFEKLDTATKKTVEWLQDRSARTSSRKLKTGLDMAQLVASVGSKDTATASSEAVTTMLNKMPGWPGLRDLWTDFAGMSESNAGLMRMINVVKSRVDALRQDYREGIPQELSKRFSRKLEREEWSRLFQGIGRADLLSLGRGDVLGMLGSKTQANKLLAEAEEKVATLGGSFASEYKSKAEALAEYMVNRRVTSKNLLRNAHAIANLYGEQGNRGRRIANTVSQDLVDSIGRLVSLYAYGKLDDATKETLAQLAETEGDGMSALTGFMASVREMELERRDHGGAVNAVARNNGWTGYVPSLVQQGASVIVAEDAKHDELIRLGYERVGVYRGDRAEAYAARRGYYQSSVAGRNTFRQGVAQTVHASWQGVDARTGQSRPGETAGLVFGDPIKRISQTVNNQAGQNDGKPAGEYLLPVFGDDGTVVAYERAMDPVKLEGMQRDTHLGRMLGVWAGRILEEEAADKFNSELIGVLKTAFDEQSSTRGDEFTNVADPNHPDPVVRDAWKALGWRIKQDAATAFGRSNYLPVRKDMVKDAIGFRSAGVTDFWSGVSRWKPEVQDGVTRAVTDILGKNAYKWLKQSEQLVQDGVSYAKTTIIVRSIKVGVQNITSNILHLAIRGVNPIKAAAGLREKFVEITEYVKNQELIQGLKIDLADAHGKPAEILKVKAQIQSLEDANGQLSIAPLLASGEFSTISENLTEADVAIREGRWGDFMETATNKLPKPLATVAKNLLITKDTALFQGLNRMVQYGDFVAKAVLYDHLTITKGVPEQEAMDDIAEAFVQYNRLPGRGRDFLESHGLLWFFNYKLRITKELIRVARERPVSALFMMGGIGPSTGIDTVASGSLGGAILDDRIGYALGPEMGYRAWTLNPFWSAIN